MLLVMDIGNTNTVVGVYDNDALINHWSVTDRDKSADEIAMIILICSGIMEFHKSIDAIAISSVVPTHDGRP